MVSDRTAVEDSREFIISIDKLTEEERQIQVEYVEKLIRKGLSQGDPYALLEAQNRLEMFEQLEPPDDVVDLVEERLSGPSYALNFDIIRIGAYLKNDKIREILEQHFTNLTDVWRETDELRLYESHRMILENVAKRADELSALRIIADPYMNTLDEFFARHFNEKKLARFPHLVQVHQSLLRMRRDGILTKDNMLAVLDAAKSKINIFVERRAAELAQIHGTTHIKPNRLIAVYYCLLEALMAQRSPLIKIDNEFIEKVAQDFRASAGDGTKRFVLNSLLQLRNDGFAEIAAEARYSIKPKTVEKLERKEAKEIGFRNVKVSLQEFQNFSLYQTAARVIARNPAPEVIRSLLFSYHSPALLLGLHALELAKLPGPVKLGHLRVLLDLGTMDDYVFTKAIQNLSSIETSSASATLARILVERYSWRKTKMPEQAMKMIQNGIYRAAGAGGLTALSEVIIGGDTFLLGKIEATYPYEGLVYDTVIDRLATRLEKNIFHGVNEIAQHKLMRALVYFVFNTRVNFAARGKRRALAAVRTLSQVSKHRLERMVNEIKAECDRFEKEVIKTLPQSERTVGQDILADGRAAQAALNQYRTKVPQEEKQLYTMAESLSRAFSSDKEDVALQLYIQRTIKQLMELGDIRMRKRDANVRDNTDEDGRFDTTMLSIRYPASSSTIIKAFPLLLIYSQRSQDEYAPPVIRSLGLRRLPPPMPMPDSPPSREETEKCWGELKPNLVRALSEEDAKKHSDEIFIITVGATANGMEDLLREMREYLYEVRQPAEMRFAHLCALPPTPEFARRWDILLSCEDDTVILALATHFSKEQRAKLKELVPGLLDLLE
jgi:uncharacterized protein YoaH (UPF0181 family)